MAKPVFYDPGQLRWRVLRRLFDVLGVTITLVVIFFIYTAIRDEQLPGLFLPNQKRPIHALKDKDKEKEKRKQLALRRRKTKKPPRRSHSMPMKASVRHFMFSGTPPVSSLREYARQNICFTPSGCTCWGQTEPCKVSTSRATNIFPS